MATAKRARSAKKTVRTPVGEILIDALDPAAWVTVPNTNGFRIYKFWEHPKTGASICLCDVPEGGTIPIRHRHASNQFMYCIEGTYEYLEPGLVLKPGTFYMNPKGNPHGPTIARTRCLLLEIYDGPHYFERPVFHTKDTVGRIAGKKSAGKKSAGKKSAGGKSVGKSVKKSAKKSARASVAPAVKRSAGTAKRAGARGTAPAVEPKAGRSAGRTRAASAGTRAKQRG